MTFIKYKHSNLVEVLMCVDGHKNLNDFNTDKGGITYSYKRVCLHHHSYWHIETIDITGTNLHAVNYYDIQMLLEGKLADLLDIVAPHIQAY